MAKKLQVKKTLQNEYEVRKDPVVSLEPCLGGKELVLERDDGTPGVFPGRFGLSGRWEAVGRG